MLRRDLYLGSLHGFLHPLEGLLGIRVAVLVRVKLLRQLTVKLGKLGGLHLDHACHQQVVGRVKELIHQEHLVFSYTYPLTHRRFAQVVAGQCFRLGVDLTLESAFLLAIHLFKIRRRIGHVTALTVTKLILHSKLCPAEHLLLHAGEV